MQSVFAQANSETELSEVWLRPVHLPAVKEIRHLNDSAWIQMVQQPAFNYTLPGEVQQEQPMSWYYKLIRAVFLFFESGWGQLLLWCLVAGIILLIVLRILRLNGHLFFLRKKRKLPVGEDETAGNLSTADWEKVMEDAVKNGNYRLAIRFAYHYLIHLMWSRNLIQFEPTKTNDQYIHELSSTTWFSPFVQMTRKYEKVWFGGFEVDRTIFEGYYTQLTELKQKLDELPKVNFHSGKFYAASLGLLLCFLSLGCKYSEQTDWNVRLSRENKNPYGLFLCFNSLNGLFPQSTIETLSPSYNISRLPNRLKNDPEHSALIFIGNSFQITDKEAEDLLNLIADGHQVMIVAEDVSQNLMRLLQTGKRKPELYNKEVQQCIVMTEEASATSYCYKGLNILSFFTAMNGTEKQYATLGQTTDKGDNFIAFAIGKGRLLLHATPLAFSNYFLLQQQNRSYLNFVFQYVLHPKRVLWMDFDYRAAQQYGNWSILWRHPATRTFLLLAIIALLLYVLFEMKRKQRIIPIIQPPVNASAAFVQTIGMLYYNTGNHSNLAEKMIQHFLEQLRSRYYINTNLPDRELAAALIAKSGWPEKEVFRLILQIRQVQSGIKVDEEFLLELYTTIQKFLNHNNGTT